MTQNITATDKAKTIILKQGGIIRTQEAIRQGIHPRTLYQLRDSGELEQLSRGVYKLGDSKPLEYPDLVTVAIRVPKGVICLVSALSFHEMTTQVPHAVSVALEKGAEQPRIDFPPVTVFRFSSECFSAGIETHMLDGFPVRIYSPEKTLADCFKFRNTIGLDVALEALQECLRAKRCSIDDLWHYARICRVANVMRPYMEAYTQ
ncbi:type IV toxin-antitoxin system AbiEi family antitoxin domain-containing protein [Prosthecochloris sp. SCSIO W1101]|uniref:type IV toxin-antitoxin system AbiEi family antitoxin domain-containing protein n=1 Tax=Prosthecochloris sp. SCSIO W1101 TaxID=2992242 RepID=UPI00223E776D|nr:type IV toxin-antitoxin system AbiEi family antitoxin domain-containing protein [Prosthecochloris sp. SCSIO W1101]UZJ40615.1 type IV toxin-antitoxin system AbiEi family antitoxin domain-containing protein [Prosthecochloris sp. SCSIO W1101]